MTHVHLGMCALSQLSIITQNTGLFPLNLYIYNEFLILKGATVRLRNSHRVLIKLQNVRCISKTALLVWTVDNPALQQSNTKLKKQSPRDLFN